MVKPLLLETVARPLIRQHANSRLDLAVGVAVKSVSAVRVKTVEEMCLETDIDVDLFPSRIGKRQTAER